RAVLAGHVLLESTELGLHRQPLAREFARLLPLLLRGFFDREGGGNLHLEATELAAQVLLLVTLLRRQQARLPSQQVVEKAAGQVCFQALPGLARLAKARLNGG